MPQRLLHCAGAQPQLVPLAHHHHVTAHPGVLGNAPPCGFPPGTFHHFAQVVTSSGGSSAIDWITAIAALVSAFVLVVGAITAWLRTTSANVAVSATAHSTPSGTVVVAKVTVANLGGSRLFIDKDARSPRVQLLSWDRGGPVAIPVETRTEMFPNDDLVDSRESVSDNAVFEVAATTSTVGWYVRVHVSMHRRWRPSWEYEPSTFAVAPATLGTHPADG